MATEGITVGDLLPIPENINTLGQPDSEEVAQSLTEKPTTSHALAMADHDEKGAAQEAHDSEVKDLVRKKRAEDTPRVGDDC